MKGLKPPDVPNIGPDTPLRLDTAVQIAFPAGGMTVSGLRREVARGHLVIEVIAGKQFTTIREIEEMRKKCRVEQRELGCGSNPQRTPQMVRSAGTQAGSSVTDRTSSARAALEKTARALKERSLNTSPANTKFPASAVVAPLKS